MARVEDQRLVIERPGAILQRIRGRFRDVSLPLSLADELIAERRAEARRESSD